MMKRIVVLSLMVVMLVGSFPAFASSVPRYSTNTDIGKVVEIIDGEVVKVFFYRRNFEEPSVEILRIIGVDTEASKEAYDYAAQRLLGKTIYIVYDEHINSMDGLDCAHVFVDQERTFAEEILEKGYAVLDNRFEEADFYADMAGAEYSARIYETGRWTTSHSETTDRININTARTSLLKDALGIDSSLASAIIAYRDANPFNDISEIMAVDYELDGDWFDENAHLLSVITNINRASYMELSSLLPTYSGIDQVVDDMIYYLKFNNVTELEDLKDVRSFSRFYGSIEDYMTVDDTVSFLEPDKKKVNVNTVDEADFTAVTGLSASDYDQLVDLRDDGDYVITALTELFRRKDLYNRANAYIYHDHMTTLTNLNTAGEFELESLFGQTDLSGIQRQDLVEELMGLRPFTNLDSVRRFLGRDLYDEISAYCYIYESDIVERYNIHTADENDLDDLAEAYDGHYTEVTNVNTASRQMLLDLNDDMTEDLVDEILNYRAKHPFRHNDDLYEIFADNDKRVLYNRIAIYLAYE